MKKVLLPLLVAGLANFSSRAALVFEDDFDDGDPAANGFAGNLLQDSGGNPMTESDGLVAWGAEGGWSWGGSNVQTLDEFTFPKADEKYTVEWTIGPMEVTVPGESWGDIRMQFILMSKNAERGTAGSAEFWSMVAGGLGVDLVYKSGGAVFANFVAKNDTSPVNSNPFGVPGQTGHEIDPTMENKLAIELTSTEASLYVNGALSQTVPLFEWDLGGGAGEEFENGFYVSTRGARVNNGRGTMAVSRVSVDLSSAAPPPPPPVPTLNIQPATPGLRMITTGGQFDRQNVRTTAPQYSWVGAPGPVTYSVTLSEYPAEANFQTVLYLVPGENLPLDRTFPDWSERICAVAFINNTAEGGGNMRFSYKNHLPESNGMSGHDYWTNDNGETYTGTEDPPLGAAGTGMGGSVAYVNSATILGTWSVTITDNINVEIKAPDGQVATGTLLPETAALFAGPVYAYFGVVPSLTSNIGLGATFSNISISGVANPINESFTSPIDPGLIEECAVNPAGVIQIIPAETPAWLRWTVPDSGYKLQQSATLTITPAWVDYATTDTLILRGEKWKLLSLTDLLNPKAGYFRLFKP